MKVLIDYPNINSARRAMQCDHKCVIGVRSGGNGLCLEYRSYKKVNNNKKNDWHGSVSSVQLN